MATYKLHFHKDGKHDFKSITEEECQKICVMHDAGPRYAHDSRFTYSFNGFGEHKGIPIGTAKACVQAFIMSKRKQNERFDIVEV